MAALIVLAACSQQAGSRAPEPELVDYQALAELQDDDKPKPRDSAWRKERYISVQEAVDRLQSHIDIPVALPDDNNWVRNYRGWLADPKYINWWKHEGETVGSLVLRKNKQILHIDYGYAGFDGCGGDTAIETNVNGQPALLQVASSDVWSSIIWPVTPNGTSGRFGLTGTFEGWQLVEIAESMDAALAARDADQGC